MRKDLSYLNLPVSVTDLVEMLPAEDIVLRVLHGAMPDVELRTMIEMDQSDMDNSPQDRFFVLVRRVNIPGYWSGDDRFIDEAGISLQVFAKDPDADEVGAIVSEACRVALRNSARDRDWYPDLGGLVGVRMLEEPIRKTDWATSSGPVQYADLPAGYQRYETQFVIRVRRP